MGEIFYLAWRYLVYHKVKSAVLIAAVTIIVYLPVGLNLLLQRSAADLNARARATPLLIGAKGSPLELVLNSLYFRSSTPPTVAYAEAGRVRATGLADVIPLQVRFRVRKTPIVGTTLDYFSFRRLRVAEGRQMAMLGECVLGARAARDLDVASGGHVISSPESVFDIAGVYPLKMPVVGVLAPTGTPDDEAVFVDIKTAWVIEGLAHGHQDLTQPEAGSGVLRVEENQVVANASVVQYNEITPENVSSFHFHGDVNAFPVTSLIVIPRDDKSSAILQGRYLGDGELVQVLQPVVVMQQLLDTVFTVGAFVTVGVILVGLATLATMVMVFLLSLQLRRREIETMVKIGGSRPRIGAVLVFEIAGVLFTGVLLAILLTACTGWAVQLATRILVTV